MEPEAMRFKVSLYSLDCAKLGRAHIEVSTTISESVGHVGRYADESIRQELLAKLVTMTKPIVRFGTTKNPFLLDISRTDRTELHRWVTHDRYYVTPSGRIHMQRKDDSITEWPTLEAGFTAYLAMVDEYIISECKYAEMFA